MKKISIALIIIGAFALGYLLRGGGSRTETQDHQDAAREATKVERWTCSMHPQIQLPKPGQCPLCGMDLVPEEVSSGENERQLVMSEAAKALAGIETVPVKREWVENGVSMVGLVDYDETRLADVIF